MSAKLLNVFGEENQELEKQIGCMTGILQMFDRHHLIMGRRLNGHNHRRLPSGHALLSDSNHKEERNPTSPQIVLEKNLTKSSNEKRRVSIESSRASFSSSSSSSFSSLECSKTTKPKSSDIVTKSVHSDFQDYVKDSIYGETRGLSVKTSTKVEVKKDNVLKHRDSPRPIMSVDLNEALRVLARLKEAPWNFSEAPRFSCDGREISRTKSANKLRELPRLSLDSKDGSLWTSNFNPKPNSVLKELDSSLNQRVPSVVAKLMGLEAMPNLSSASQEPMESVKTDTNKTCDSFNGDSEKDWILCSMSSLESSDTQRLMNSSLLTKPMSKQTESVYSQIERRLKELEFHGSTKDLRALKHVLDTIQAKGLIETMKGDDQHPKVTNQKSQNMKSMNAQNSQITAPRAFESPIVIMKPTKSIKRSGKLEGVSGLRKQQTSDPENRKKAKDQTSKASLREPSSEKKTEDISLQKTQIPLMQRSPKLQQSGRERHGSPVKTSSSLSPKVQQRKLEPEKKPRPPTRRQSASRQPLEPVSPRGKLRPKPSQAQQTDEQLNKVSSETRNSSNQGDEISQGEDGNISLASQVDGEVTSADQSIQMNPPLFQQGKQKKSLLILKEEVSTMEVAAVASEQPSPVSVLDASFYQDELPPSPVKKISNALEDDEARPPSEDCWNAMSLLDTTPSKLGSETNLKKLDNIKHMVQKLIQLSSTDDEPPATETQEPDHYYLSQILLASGLQPKDLSSEAIQENTPWPKPNPEKLHQKLMFDVVHEILVQKLELMSHGLQPDLWIKARKHNKLNGQHLLRELCSDIERGRPTGTSLDNENLILNEDSLHRSEGWEDFGFEVPKVVLEIERLIFKDLIDEIVSGENDSGLHAKPSRRRRQLFIKCMD